MMYWSEVIGLQKHDTKLPYSAVNIHRYNSYHEASGTPWKFAFGDARPRLNQRGVVIYAKKTTLHKDDILIL